MHSTRFLLISLILALSPLITGCGGSNVGQVEGVVTLDGKPVAAARVRFRPEEGRGSWTETDADGHYEIEFEKGKPGAVVGQHTVTIATFRPRFGLDGSREDTREIVPAKYNSESELRREVVPGQQTINFELVTGD